MEELTKAEVVVLAILSTHLNDPRAFSREMFEFAVNEEALKMGVNRPDVRVAVTLLKDRNEIEVTNKRLHDKGSAYPAYVITGKGLKRLKPNNPEVKREKKEVSAAKETTSSNILNPLVDGISSDAWSRGAYRNAVHDAFIAVIDELKKKLKYPKLPNGREMDGDALVRYAFGGDKPILFFVSRPNAADTDFQNGVLYLWLSIVAFRNEKAHKITEIKDKNIAYHYLALASLAITHLENSKQRKATKKDTQLKLRPNSRNEITTEPLEHPYIYMSGYSVSPNSLSLNVFNDEPDSYYLETIEVGGTVGSVRRQLPAHEHSANLSVQDALLPPYEQKFETIALIVSRVKKKYKITQRLSMERVAGNKFVLSGFEERPIKIEKIA